MNDFEPLLEIRVARQSDEDEIIELYRFVKGAYGDLTESVESTAAVRDKLYAREPIERYVAIRYGHIVGHGVIDNPNPEFLPAWRDAIHQSRKPRIIEIGGLLVDPLFNRTGVGTALFKHRLATVHKLEAVPVSSTLTNRVHIKQAFKALGGVEVGRTTTEEGMNSLFIFQKD